MVALNQQDAKRQQQVQVQGQQQNIFAMLEKMKPQIERALPRHLRADRMLRIVTTELRKSPKLGLCDPMSLMGAVIKSSQLGLEPGDALGHAYLIPYGKECQLIIGYRGYIALARRSGEIKSISAHVVRQGDFFEAEYGTAERLVHKPIGLGFGGTAIPDGYDLDSAIIAAYSVAQLKDGGVQSDIKLRWQIDKTKHASTSKAYKPNDPKLPWNAYFEEMARKTSIRALFKYLPVSVELDRAVALDEDADRGLAQNNFQLETPDGSLIEMPYTQEPEENPQPNGEAVPAATTSVTGAKIEELRAHLKPLLEKATAMGMKADALGISLPFERDEKRTVLYIETVSQWLTQKEKAAATPS